LTLEDTIALIPFISKNECGESTIWLAGESVAKIQKNVIVGLITGQKTRAGA